LQSIPFPAITLTTGMIKNYLKIAWRNLLKNKSFSFINIFGLSIGIAACMIIFLYVHNELTFDQYNKKVDRIARVSTIVHAPESDINLATSPNLLADVLKRDYPEVASTVRLEAAPQVIKLNDDLSKEAAFYKADQSIFSIFDFDFLEGTATGALQKPQSVVLTATMAKKYFGNTSALGKTMICGDQNLMVTAVVKNRPANSDIHIDALLATDFSKTANWGDFDPYTFVLFHNKPNLKNFERKLLTVSKKYVDPLLNTDGAKGYSAQFELEPLAAVHFSKGKFSDTPKGNRQFSYIFSLLAVFILIIALLNYINLSTAKSMERAREVGIRKVSGAGPFQLIRQFLFESFLLVAIAWILAVGWVVLSLPFFNSLLQTKLAINGTQSILFMGIIFVVTFLLAGLYPAFVLSSFSPVTVLKGSWRHNIKGVLLRKAVTVTQFGIAAALIMGTAVIYRQMKYIEQTDLGFNKNQLLNIYLPRDSAYQHTVKIFQNELKQRPEIQDMTVGSGMTESGMTIASTVIYAEGKKRELMFNYFSIDDRFLPVFQIHLLEGRNLSDSLTTDRHEGFLVNEALVKAMGWNQGLGKELEGFGHKGKIVGVVKNFYYKSLHNLVEPLVLAWNNNPINTTTIRIKPKDLPIAKAIYKKDFPAIPFDYAFFDEMVNKQYQQDKINMSLFNDFTLLAIFVSCLGLYGLVALIAVQRTKEISIRKVLGASLVQLLSLMTKDFIKLILLALAIALPIAGMVMNKWLASYAYHIQLSWWMFLIPVLLILIIAIAVISKEIIKTALANPVKSLRME
jgi:putative ABC transport system permease protein